jgi:uncharacterized protein
MSNKSKASLIGLCAVLSAALIFLYSACIEPNEVEINHIYIRDAALERIFGNKVVVQLSDLHIRNIGSREQKVLGILKNLDPDIIFLTGDYVPWKGDYAPAMEFISQLHAKTGIWAIMGDYDYSNSRQSCLFCHEKESGKPASTHRVRFLRNNSELLRLPEGEVRLAGVDGEDSDSNDAKTTFSGIGYEAPIILLCHNPLIFDHLPQGYNILMLSGDTHGGQIPLPSWAFRIVGYDKNALYNQGLFEKGSNKMYVSRGIGWSHLPVRLFRKPEVLVLHFIN